MTRVRSWFPLATLLLALAPQSGAAHGGTWRGPGSTVGPSGPGAGPATGGGVPGGGGPSTGGGADASDPASWATWWAFNRDPLLGLRGALERAARAAQGASGASSGPAARPRDDAVLARVLPALLETLDEERNPDVVTAALLALAKTGPRLPRDAAREASAAIRVRLADANQEVAESAAVALGILARGADAPLLADLLANAPLGRQAIGGEAIEGVEVPRRTRAYAAYALGVLAARSANPDLRRFAAHHLARALAQPQGASRDVHVAALMALGIAPLPGSNVAGAAAAPDVADAPGEPAPNTLEGEIALLSALCADLQRDELVRAWALVPLARLASAAGEDARAPAMATISNGLREHSSDPASVRQGAAIALGILADGDGDETDASARGLLRAAGTRGDRLARRLCWISSARSAARVGKDGAHALESSRAWLMSELARGSTQERPWLSLALALGERDARAQGIEPSRAVQDLLASTFHRHQSPTEAGAHALALALAEVPRASAMLLERLAERPDDVVRAHCALALGITGERAAIGPLREIVLASNYRPELLREASIALGLLGDRELTAALVALLRDARGLTAQAAAASALGWVGDERALDPLLAMAKDTGLDVGIRAFAIVAIGLLCDPAPLPWNSPYAVDGQWWLAPPTLHDPLTFTGVIDLF